MATTSNGSGSGFTILQAAGWASVLMMLGAAALWPLYEADKRHELQIDQLDHRQDSHVGDGHPLRFAESIESNLVAVNERNRVLQQQLDAVKDQVQILHVQNKDRADRANLWIDESGAKLATELAAIRERLAAVERRQEVAR